MYLVEVCLKRLVLPVAPLSSFFEELLIRQFFLLEMVVRTGFGRVTRSGILGPEMMTPGHVVFIVLCIVRRFPRGIAVICPGANC
jgi:hypothetical protein